MGPDERDKKSIFKKLNATLLLLDVGFQSMASFIKLLEEGSERWPLAPP
jgi:hypothetical protein